MRLSIRAGREAGVEARSSPIYDPLQVRVAVTCDHRTVTESSDADVDRAPICPQCGVTALPADIATVLDSRFVCENPDCEAFGDVVETRS